MCSLKILRICCPDSRRVNFIAVQMSLHQHVSCLRVFLNNIAPGQWVHVHNVRTGLSEDGEYTYRHKTYDLPQVAPRTFRGFRRPDGRAGIRNELWIIPTVGCVNNIAQQLVRENQHLVTGNVEGLYTFPHPFGCSQMGDDHAQTRKLLAALVRHPNAGGVLVLGLGCENLTMDQFKEELGEWDSERVKFLVCQEEQDEIAAGAALLSQLAGYAASFRREDICASELVVGMKCGGSDGLSGITANPTVGRFSDRLIALGGSTVLTEVPEMFGAESILFERCADEAVFRKAVKMIEDFKGYFTSHGQVVYENPSPGNKAGGITTLEDKSCGCVQKGGLRPDRRRAGLRRGCHKEGAEPVVRTGQRPGVRHRPHRRRGSPDPVHHRQGYPLRCPRPHGEDLHQHRPL